MSRYIGGKFCENLTFERAFRLLTKRTKKKPVDVCRSMIDSRMKAGDIAVNPKIGEVIRYKQGKWWHCWDSVK